MNKEKSKYNRIRLKYLCLYCKDNYEFEADGYAEDSGVHKVITLQVQCPKCGNFLATNSGR